MKMDYVFIIGLMAAVDGLISNEERDYINTICNMLELNETDVEAVNEKIRLYPEEKIDILKQFTSLDIRYTLIWDLLVMQYADGLIMDEETAYLQEIASALMVSEEQVNFMIILMEKGRKEKTFSNLKDQFANNLTKLSIPFEYILF